MKHIAFKKVDLVNPKTLEKGEFDYREMLKALVHNPMDGKSLDIDEVRSSIRLLDALEKGNEEGADLEDADFAFLVKKIQSIKFTWADPVFINFVDDVTGAK